MYVKKRFIFVICIDFSISGMAIRRKLFVIEAQMTTASIGAGAAAVEEEGTDTAISSGRLLRAIGGRATVPPTTGTTTASHSTSWTLGAAGRTAEGEADPTAEEEGEETTEGGRTRGRPIGSAGRGAKAEEMTKTKRQRRRSRRIPPPVATRSILPLKPAAQARMRKTAAAAHLAAEAPAAALGANHPPGKRRKSKEIPR